MSRHAIEGLSDYERAKAKSWADELFHNAPQTEKFFDPNISLSEIKSRHEQKQEARNEGKSLQLSETSKYFERNNVTTITHNLRPSFNQFFEFAYKNGNRHINNAISPKVMQRYLQFLEQKVYDRKLTPDTFSEYVSRMKILASMSTATKGLPDLNIDRMTDKIKNRVNAYVEKMKNTNNPVVNDKHKVHAYTGDELEKIIDNVKGEKEKISLEIIKETGFRIENATVAPLNTQWKRIGKKEWIREYTPENKIAIVAKGNQRHTVTISPELFEKMKENADKDNIFIVNQNDLRDATKQSCEDSNIKYISVHNIRATVAYRLYNELKEKGYSEKQARQIVSNKLYHGREDITMYYINSANKK